LANVLSLDISSKSTGYAVFSGSKIHPKGLGLITLDHKTHGEKLLNFEREVADLIGRFEVVKVCVEDVWGGPNPRTLQVLSYYHGAVRKEVFFQLEAEPFVLGASEVRSILGAKYNKVLMHSKRSKLSGKGKKTSKELTFDFIKSKYKLTKYSFKKHNDITDAIALGLANNLLENGYARPVSKTRGKKRRK
jgi:Holliday junction resolvasome RuvABC endonuclease subunit